MTSIIDAILLRRDSQFKKCGRTFILFPFVCVYVCKTRLNPCHAVKQFHTHVHTGINSNKMHLFYSFSCPKSRVTCLIQQNKRQTNVTLSKHFGCWFRSWTPNMIICAQSCGKIAMNETGLKVKFSFQWTRVSTRVLYNDSQMCSFKDISDSAARWFILLNTN